MTKASEKTYKVCAGWLTENPTIGELHIQFLSGKEILSFSYDNSWLEAHRSLFLDPDLMPYRGRQYVPAGKAAWGFLEDCAPDRWGRKLIEKAERIHAEEDARSIRKLQESDYILGVSDFTRTGALRFANPQGNFLSCDENFPVPPIADLRKLQQAAEHFENDIRDRWYWQLFTNGSSLGGARPKSNVLNTDGSLWIAKFPSRHDDYHLESWEMAANELARICGLNVPETMLESFDGKETFLEKRFDRNGEKRILFLSAMTALGCVDGGSDEKGYLDIAEFIRSNGADPSSDLRELWARIVFGLLINNTDDHLRNHGFLLREDGWHLSPLFDVNPSLNAHVHALGLFGGDNDYRMEDVLAASEYFDIAREEGSAFIAKMSAVIASQWKDIAEKYHIPRSEQREMESAFR